MDAVLLEFMRHIRKRYAPTTYDRTFWEIGNFERFLTENKKDLYRITGADLETYLLSMNCGYETKHRRLDTLRHLYEYLKVPNNPATEIHMRPFRRIGLFKEPKWETVTDVLSRMRRPVGELELRNRLIFELLYGSGIRRTELTRLNIEDIDLVSGTMRVLGKGSKERIVPITAAAAAVYRQYCAVRHASRGPLLISYCGRRLVPVSIYVICKTKIGIRPHLLRHACASHMLKNGCDIRHIQELLGHNDLTTTQIYTHINKRDLKVVVNRMHPRCAHHRAMVKVVQRAGGRSLKSDEV